MLFWWGPGGTPGPCLEKINVFLFLLQKIIFCTLISMLDTTQYARRDVSGNRSKHIEMLSQNM